MFDEIEKLISLKQIIFGLCNENIKQSAYLIINKFDEKFSFSLNLIISQMIYEFSIKLMNDTKIYMDFIKEIETFEENNKSKSKIFDVFVGFLHKKLIREGINPNDIAKIIRNDEIEKLQEISSQNDFDFNQKIKRSPYERYSFINQNNVRLIEFAAFFGSVKCFKYLLLNNSYIRNTGKYAVEGGNLEIIHLCEQNHSSFHGSYEVAIEFH